jgi:RNA polymerase sigma-70 factor, ECF subfamily
MENTGTQVSSSAGYPLPSVQDRSTIAGTRLKEFAMSARRVPTVAEFEAEAMPHLNDLFRTATRVLRDPFRAEDVVQEVYLQAWKSFDRFEPGTNCKAWLYKILFHSVNHYRRKWFRLRILSENEEHLAENLTWTPPLPEHLTDAEILTALDKIPPDFKAVVLLVDVEEFAYKDVADILEIPIGTVMSRLSRGRKLLRVQLLEVAQAWGIGKTAAEGQNL